MALTNKQRRFVDEYLIDLNATQAAIRAGYAAKTANREGSRLLSNVDIADAIAEKAAEKAAALDLSAERVLGLTAGGAFLVCSRSGLGGHQSITRWPSKDRIACP